MESERRQTQTGGRDAVMGFIEGDVALSVGMPKSLPPKGFRWRLLSDLARLESGHTPSRKVSEYWDNGDVPWITVKHAAAHHGQTLYETEEYITELGELNSSARLLPANTVCLTRTGSLGFVVVAGVPMCTSQGLVNWVCGPEIDYRYLKYVLLAESGSFHRFSWGSAHQTIYFPEVKAFHVLLPSLTEQSAIADVLGGIDDKIESNRRLQELCMSLATVEHICWRETVAALIETTFGDFCDVFGGATPSTEEPSYWGGKHAWLTPTDVTALDAPYLFATSRTLTEAGLKVSSTRMHPVGTIFMTSRATIGAFAVTQIPCSTNQGFIAVQPRQDSHRWFIFHEMKSRVELMFDMSSGSTFRELSRGTFKSMAVSVPELEADFNRLAVVLEPLHTKAMNASRENLKLRALRDALLPELLSGRLRVKDAELIVENV